MRINESKISSRMLDLMGSGFFGKNVLQENENPYDDNDLKRLEEMLFTWEDDNIDLVFAMLEDYPSALDRLMNNSGLGQWLDYIELPRDKDGIYKFRYARYITIDGKSELVEIPEFIINLPNLAHLTITNCGIKSLPSKIETFWLRELVLTNNNITVLPDSIGNLKELVYLDLANNGIEYLPESIGELGELGHLDLSENNLQRLPDSFSKLVELEHLDLSGNDIKELKKYPSVPYDFKKLEYVNLDGNHNLTNAAPAKGFARDLEDLEHIFGYGAYIEYNHHRK
jgi:hypothetical protein